MDRRGFLIGGSALLSLGLSGLARSRAWAAAGRPEVAGDGPLTAAQWRLVGAVQAHLFPSEADAPGAAEVNALGYLRFVLSMPEPEAREAAELIAGGAARLARLCRERGKPFEAMDEAEREALLRRFEQSPEGRHWLTEILGYIFEALLTDPVYGGNPGGIGWQWLDHRPGFPRPPADKRYFLL